MSTPSFDPDRYKSGQRQDWDTVAGAWQKWWLVFEKGAQQVSDRLAELAGVGTGQHVLDIATGIGEPAVSVAKIVGPQGSVVATDQSPSMIATAQKRVNELGLANVEFIESDTEAIDFTDETFDAVVCRWGLMFLPNLQEALTRIRRTLKSDAKFATSVWSTPDKAPFLSLPMGVAQRVLDPPPAPPPSNAPSVFKLGAPGAIESAFEQAGFRNVRSEVLDLEFSFESPEMYRDFMGETGAPFRALISDRSPEVKKAFLDAIVEEVRGFASANGSVKMPGQVILVVGSK